jgi:multidrug efflux pump subunit AcrB
VPRAIAQVTAVSQADLKPLPTGATPPLVLSYTATNVPVLSLGLTGLSEQELNDYGLNFVRTQLITVPGVAVPYPYGGKVRTVEVDLDYKALQGYGLTPFDVVNTINAQNLILPSGTQKIGLFEYQVGLNASPDTMEKLNAIPIKTLPDGTTIRIRDVAHIYNGSTPQIASYILSRTLVPTLAMYWIRKHTGASHQGRKRKGFSFFGWASRFHQGFEHRFEQFREAYRDLLSLGLHHGGKLVSLVLGFAVVSMSLVPFLGQDFFPSVDAGEFDMHVRMRSGTRIEETARSVDQIEQMIRQIIPADQLQGIIDNLGIPYSGINTSYNTTGTMSPADGDILVTLNPKHDPTNKFVEAIRARMQHDFPDVGVWFPPPDIATQILNFGLPAPIDVQITGPTERPIFSSPGTS